MTHRDPVQTLASICKMTFNLPAMRSGKAAERHEVGKDMQRFGILRTGWACPLRHQLPDRPRSDQGLAVAGE
jgi:hypothetical protein